MDDQTGSRKNKIRCINDEEISIASFDRPHFSVIASDLNMKRIRKELTDTPS